MASSGAARTAFVLNVSYDLYLHFDGASWGTSSADRFPRYDFGRGISLFTLVMELVIELVVQIARIVCPLLLWIAGKFEWRWIAHLLPVISRVSVCVLNVDFLIWPSAETSRERVLFLATAAASTRSSSGSTPATARLPCHEPSSHRLTLRLGL
jgi:hypothetical protein